MKFGYVNLALHSWNDELPVFILEESPTHLCPNKWYINCGMKIKKILWVSRAMLTVTSRISRTEHINRGSKFFLFKKCLLFFLTKNEYLLNFRSLNR